MQYNSFEIGLLGEPSLSGLLYNNYRFNMHQQFIARHLVGFVRMCDRLYMTYLIVL